MAVKFIAKHSLETKPSLELEGGQAANAHLNKVVILQNVLMCVLMYFSDYTSHSAPLFACSGILPIKMLYFKLVASLLHDIVNCCAPPNISELFTRSEQVHSYSTRLSVAHGSFYIKQARTNHQLLFSLELVRKYGMAFPLNFVS